MKRDETKCVSSAPRATSEAFLPLPLHLNDTYFISLHLAGWTPIGTPGMIWGGDGLESVLFSKPTLRRVNPTHILDVCFCT